MWNTKAVRHFVISSSQRNSIKKKSLPITNTTHAMRDLMLPFIFCMSFKQDRTVESSSFLPRMQKYSS